MQQLTAPHLSNTAAQALLNAIPEKIKLGLIAYAAELEYPMTYGRSLTIEVVIEMAFTKCLW